MLYGIFCFCKGFIQFLTFLAGPLILSVVFFSFLVAIEWLCRRYLFKWKIPAADTLRIAPFIAYASNEEDSGDEYDEEEKKNEKGHDFMPLGPFYMWSLSHEM